MEAELRLKRVYECAEKEDGVRVLVDRLWPRGVRKDALACDLWAKEATPSKELRMLYHRGELDFEGFSKAYLEELSASEDAGAFAEKCASWLAKGNVTLLYAAKDTAQNHALVLRGWLIGRLSSLALR